MGERENSELRLRLEVRASPSEAWSSLALCDSEPPPNPRGLLGLDQVPVPLLLFQTQLFLFSSADTHTDLLYFKVLSHIFLFFWNIPPLFFTRPLKVILFQKELLQM